MPKGTVFTAVRKQCPTCGHPADSETPCIHKLHPELFRVNEDGLMVRDQ